MNYLISYIKSLFGFLSGLGLLFLSVALFDGSDMAKIAIYYSLVGALIGPLTEVIRNYENK